MLKLLQVGGGSNIYDVTFVAIMGLRQYCPPFYLKSRSSIFHSVDNDRQTRTIIVAV
jgi:hypothetical protein